MTEPNFAELLKTQVDSVERPKLFPAGNYSAMCIGHEFGKSPQKETPFVQFNCKLLGPLEDVDVEEFEAAGGAEALTERKPLPYKFYLTKDAFFRCREFLEDVLQINSSGRTFDEVIPESTNAPFTAAVTHIPGRKEGEYYMVIDDAAAQLD